MKAFLVTLILLASTAFAMADDLQCADPGKSRDRIGDLPDTIFLPDIVITSRSKIVRWTDGTSIYAFTQVDECAVIAVFWLGPYLPTANV
jgi:hypothetical protein